MIDSSVLIHLCRAGNLGLLREYFGEVRITKQIYQELKKGKRGVSEFEKGIDDWILISKPNNKEEIEKVSQAEGIEKADASILLLAYQKKEKLLSNDYALIMVGRSKNIECWWLTTFIFKCLEKEILNKEEAREVLDRLIDSGMNLSNKAYSAILRKIDKV